MMAGTIKKFPYEVKIEWIIPNFFKKISDQIQNIHQSPHFSFTDSGGPWFMVLNPRLIDKFHPHEFLFVRLFRHVKLEYSVEGHFGLKRSDGSIEQLNSGILVKGKKMSAPINLIRETELLKRKSDLVPGNTLTITCTMMFPNEDSYSSSWTCDQINSTELRKLDTLSDNLKHLLADKESCDTILNVQNREYKAHSAILIARSSVFAAMFSHETSEKQDHIINITDCDPESFGEFLEFLYSGKLHTLSFDTALHLHYTSSKYNIEELKTFCLQNLAKNLSVENVCDVVTIADMYEEKNLMSAAQEFFNENLHEILDTSKWDSLVKHNYCLSKALLKEMSSKRRKDSSE